MLTLHAHPFSSYCQKVLIALYENATPFTFRMLGDSPSMEELAALWPFKRFPVMVDDGRTVVESSIIIEHLDLHHPGKVRLIPQDAKAALEVRMMDRFFDIYINTPQQKVVFDAIRAAENRDRLGVDEARAMLDTAYAWLDKTMAGREWAAGAGFSLADCAAAPALFYADWTHFIDSRFANVHAYRRRLLARPSFARAVDEARPYRKYFPLGAPDRDSHDLLTKTGNYAHGLRRLPVCMACLKSNPALQHFVRCTHHIKSRLHGVPTNPIGRTAEAAEY